MTFSAMSVCVCELVHMCVRTHVRFQVILCACVFAVLCMKMLIFMFCTLVYLRIVCFSLSSVVKHFEFLKALCKFPIIMIIIVYSGSNFEIPSMNM